MPLPSRKFKSKPCKYCGEIFKYQFRTDRPRQFCSNACRGKACYGANHYGWKGGSISDEGYRKVSMHAFPDRFHELLTPMKTMVHHRNYLLEHRAVMAIQLG